MLKVSNKNRKKEKVIEGNPFVSSSFKKEEIVDKEEPLEGIQYDPSAGVIINYEVREDDHPEFHKLMRKRQNDDVSIVILWISIIVVSAIGLML